MVDEKLQLMSERPPPAPADVPTPMIAQYLEIKSANADCLLFYRMGDFYEMFFADAETASRALGIALTKRGSISARTSRCAACPCMPQTTIFSA